MGRPRVQHRRERLAGESRTQEMSGQYSMGVSINEQVSFISNLN